MAKDKVGGQLVARPLVEAAVVKLKQELVDARIHERAAARELALGRIGNLTAIELERLSVKARECRAVSRRIVVELSLLSEALSS